MIGTIILDTFKFILVIPFEENMVFPFLMIAVFVISLLRGKIKNKQNLNTYKENKDTLIYDEYKEPISLYATSGILMSIGIVGTFYLIYASLHHLSSSIEIQNILNVITDNIAPAFSISALGITLSIFYVLIEKIFILEPYRKEMEDLGKDSDIVTYVGLERQQIEMSKKSLLATEQQTEAFKSLNNFAGSLEEASEGLKMFGDIAVTLDSTLNPTKLGEVISTALMEQISPILNHVSEITEKVNENSKEIKEFLEKDLKNDVIIPLKDSVYSSSESMKSIENTLEQTSKAMNRTNEGFDKLNNNLDKLDNLQESFVKNLDTVLDRQKVEFEKTTSTIVDTYSVLTQKVTDTTDEFEKNSHIILESFTGLASEMKEFLVEYKVDYEIIIKEQKNAIKETSAKSLELLDATGKKTSGLIAIASNRLKDNLENANNTLVTTAKQTSNNIIIAGNEASNLIKNASNTLQSTLAGIDGALIQTSDSIQEELKVFRNTYTKGLKIFLEAQGKELEKVFGKNTENLTQIVIDFKEVFQEVLKDDVVNRSNINKDLEELVKKTNGLVVGTEAKMSSILDEQQNQITSFIKSSQSMQSELRTMIGNAANMNSRGNILAKELMEDTTRLQKRFNDNQIETLQKYQKEVDRHLQNILKQITNVFEASQIEKNRD